jgi:phenylacetaldehyde dehydrogenase
VSIRDEAEEPEAEEDAMTLPVDADDVAHQRDRAHRRAARSWRMLVGDAWVDGRKGRVLDVIDPATGQVFARAPAGDGEDVDVAVAAARRAFEQRLWTGLGGAERGRRLARVADLIEAHAEALQDLEMLNNGVPLSMAQFFTAFAADAFRYYSGWCGKVAGLTADLSGPGGEFHAYTLKEPVGVAALIVPWNGPLGAASMKLAAALAAGCACVLKPAEETPLSALLLGELLLEAGIPAGVVNIVTGYGHEAGAALAAHPDVNLISFTGSTEVGKMIARAAAGTLKKVLLELGGKSPVVIFDDADMERAIPGAALGTFFNTGQVCVAGSRVYVQRGAYDRVVEGMSAVGRSLRLGGGFDGPADIGPLISSKQLGRVTEKLDAARADGASILGGARPSRPGFFIEPAVVVGAPPHSVVVREEIFGPVITAVPFDTPEEALQLANASRYGLAAAVWTRDINLAHRFANRAQAGTVWINCQLVLSAAMPFGGYKESGWGRENGAEGLDSYMHTKSVIAAL